MNTTDRLAAAIARFPTTFGLRAWPSELFRVDIENSYINNKDEPILYLARQTANNQWIPFGKGSVDELEREHTAIPHGPSTPREHELNLRRDTITFTVDRMLEGLDPSERDFWLKQLIDSLNQRRS